MVDDLQTGTTAGTALSGADARQAKRDADAAYKQAVTDIGSILDAARRTGKIAPDEVERQQQSILDMYHGSDHSLLFESLNVVRIDHDYYRYHSVNVALLNAMIGSQMNLTTPNLALLVKIGLVHDLGMMMVSSTIAESGKLTDEQLAEVRKHPEYSVKILKDSGITDEKLLEGVLRHHERQNGSGYPGRLSGDAIPMEAQITAVSDSYDAAVARKKYKKPKSPFDLLAEFSANTGGALNPAVTRTAVQGLANLMIGRQVTLSDQSVGIVMEIDADNLAYPVVRQLGRRVRTGPQLHPVSLSGFMPLF